MQRTPGHAPVRIVHPMHGLPRAGPRGGANDLILISLKHRLILFLVPACFLSARRRRLLSRQPRGSHATAGLAAGSAPIHRDTAKKRGTLSGAHAIAERYPVCEHKVAAKSHCDTPGRGSTTLLAVLRSGGTLAMRATLLLLVVLERALSTIGASLPLSDIGVRNQAASPGRRGRQDGDE